MDFWACWEGWICLFSYLLFSGGAYVGFGRLEAGVMVGNLEYKNYLQMSYVTWFFVSALEKLMHQIYKLWSVVNLHHITNQVWFLPEKSQSHG